MQATIPHPVSSRDNTVTPPVDGLLGSPAGELVLQICGGEHDGRVLRLKAAKCLIGSAVGCTLRLRAPGIRPVHALILRGPAGAIVRAWSPDALLNERALAESLLQAGDKLQIGPVTLVVMELANCIPARHSAFCLPPAPSEEKAANRPSRNHEPRNRERRKRLFEQFRREREHQSQLQATVESQRHEMESLQQELVQLQISVTDVASDIPPPATDDALNQQLSATIQQLQQELEAAAKRRAVDQQAAARNKIAWEEQAEQRLQSQLAAARQRWELEREQQSRAATQELEARHTNLLKAAEQKQLTARREIEALQTALDAKGKGEDASRAAFAAQVEQLNQAFALVRRERDELLDQLQAEQQQQDERAARGQKQLDEARQLAQEQIEVARTKAQTEIQQLRAELAARQLQWDEDLLARTKAETDRRADEAERLAKVTAEWEAFRTDAVASAAAHRQQQEGFTQARHRWEAEIVTLNGRLQQAEDALHEARVNSGQVQVAVLAEAERARAQRDAISEEMLKQQHEWTEFRSRIESAAVTERELAQTRYAALEAELQASTAATARLQTECSKLERQLEKVRVELEQSQEALFAAESGANQRLQQMTISMEQLHVERGGAESQLEQARVEWNRERDALAQCIAELQHEVAQLTTRAETLEQQIRETTSAAAAQADANQQQLQQAQEQLAQWQATAEEARRQVTELLESSNRLQAQEQAWQLEREQLDEVQQRSRERMQHLESSISVLQQQLDEAQRAALVTSPKPGELPPNIGEENIGCTVNVNNQELAALRERPCLVPPAESIGSTINVANQDLAALQEQMNEVPSLFGPIAVLNSEQLAMFQGREAALQEQADELAAQQSQLEEEQAIVARQRIELEQFQASLMELERSLSERADAMLQQATPAAIQPEPAADPYGDSYYGEAERESNQLSESEAFAAMADQVANLYRSPEDVRASVIRKSAAIESNIVALPEEPTFPAEFSPPACDEEACDEGESLIIPSMPNSLDAYEPAIEAIAAEGLEDAARSAIIAPSDVTPEQQEDFDRQLDARIARVMRREKTAWTVAPSEEPAAQSVSEEPAPEEPEATKSQAVNSVLDRLREAGLWKGEGTAKVDQLPSSAPPVDDGGTGLCRRSHEGPIGSPADEVAIEETADDAIQPVEEDSSDLSLLAQPQNAPATLLKTPPSDQSEADDSIESYMSRLMARLRTSDEEEAPRKTNSRPDPRQARNAAPPPPPPPPKPSDSRPLTSLTELAPRSQAPELNANLAAMRELANSAARGAIECHQRRTGKQRVNMRTLNTLLALLVCAGMILFWIRSGFWIALAGAVLSLCWAIGSSLVAGYQSAKLRQPGTEQPETKAD